MLYTGMLTAAGRAGLLVESTATVYGCELCMQMLLAFTNRKQFARVVGSENMLRLT